MSWEREMDEAIAAQFPTSVMDERSKEMRARLDAMPIAARTLEQLDTALCEPVEPLVTTNGVMKGSITFAPDASKPCYCANCVVLQQDIARLRLGNAAVIHDNQRLQHEVARLEQRLEVASGTIRLLETELEGEMSRPKKITTENHVKALVADWFNRRQGWHYAPIQSGLGVHGVHDRVGGIPIVVTPEMVGKTVNLAVTIESKKPGRRGEKDRGMSKHQVLFMEGVRNAGGLSICCDGQDDLDVLDAWIAVLTGQAL